MASGGKSGNVASSDCSEQVSCQVALKGATEATTIKDNRKYADWTSVAIGSIL